MVYVDGCRLQRSVALPTSFHSLHHSSPLHLFIPHPHFLSRLLPPTPGGEGRMTPTRLLSGPGESYRTTHSWSNYLSSTHLRNHLHKELIEELYYWNTLVRLS